MHKHELRKKIEEIESLRLEYYSRVQRKMLEDLRAGRPMDSRFIDSSGMKERYLEALDFYSIFGLTPRELYEKRIYWLHRPGEDKMPKRIKTVSMFLHRLYVDVLARIEREGRTFRYFITENGRRRLSYYKNQKRQVSDEQSLDQLFFREFLEKSIMMGEMKNRHAFIELLMESLRNPAFSAIYSYLWEMIEKLFDVIIFLQLSNILRSPNTMRFAFKEANRCLIKLQDMQKAVLASLSK